MGSRTILSYRNKKLKVQSNPKIEKEILPYFPRGKGPLISIILPTRGRSQGLINTVDSLHSLARDKYNLEFIFKADDDDISTIYTVDKMSSLIPNCKSITSPRGRGYLDLHIWINQMCEVASGDWLFLMNDDAVMATQDWDDTIKKTVPAEIWPGMTEICLLVLGEEGVPNSTAFSLLRRQTYDLLGHLSLSPLCDGWLWKIMACCGCLGYTPNISVKHQRICDQLSKENSAVSKAALKASFSYEQIKLRTEDVVKITNRIGWFESTRKWSTTPPKQEGWVLWKEHMNDAPINVYFRNENKIGIYEEGGTKSVKRLNEMNGLWSERNQ